MKKSKLSLAFFFLCGILQAQVNYAWYPFHPNTSYNYALDSSLIPITTVIKIDSLSGTPTHFHLNKIVKNCDTCHNAFLVNDVYDSTYVLSNQPQFAGHYFYQTSGKDLYFKGPNSFLLRPFKPIGSSWIFDSLANISATLVAKNVQIVLGNSDSICVIRLSGTNDTILLSKNYGILRYPFRIGSSHYYTLAGLEGTVNAGKRLKRFHDFFDFQVGDVFQYSFSDNDFNFLPPQLKQGLERWDVLSVNIYTDSVCCKIRTTYFDSLKIGGNAPTITAYTYTINVSFVDSAQHLANLYPLQEIRVDPYFLYPYGGVYIHKIVPGLNDKGLTTKSFGVNCPNISLSPGTSGAAAATAFTDVYLNRNSRLITGRELTEGRGITSEVFNDHDRLYQRCLIGSVRNADTSGTVYDSNPLGIPMLANQSNAYVLRPVPANEEVSVSGPLQKGMRLSLVNAYGALVLEEMIQQTENTHILSTLLLGNGLYFVCISDQNSTRVKKLVVSH